MGEGNAILVTIVGGEEEDVGKLRELVGSQDGVIGEANRGDHFSGVWETDSLCKLLGYF